MHLWFKVFLGFMVLCVAAIIFCAGGATEEKLAQGREQKSDTRDRSLAELSWIADCSMIGDIQPQECTSKADYLHKLGYFNSLQNRQPGIIQQ